MNVDAQIAAIPTRYAGCHFRSRLEARWAVFFDCLGITWEYEPQGFEATWRLDPCLHGAPLRYLPDFWLPDLRTFVEVKGSLTDTEAWRFLNAAASISANRGGGCGDGPIVVALGPIPRPGDPYVPAQLHLHKGDMIMSSWLADPHRGTTIANDSGMRPCRSFVEQLLNGVPDAHGTGAKIVAAYAGARSARFEHGQSGAT